MFSKEKVHKLQEHRPHDYTIETEENIPFGPIYNLSLTELNALREYLDGQLAKGYIVLSKSSAGAPILFAKKKDGGLRLRVDY